MRRQALLAVAGFVIGAAALAGGGEEPDLRAELDRLRREVARAMQHGWEVRNEPPADDRGNELALLRLDDVLAPLHDAIPPSHLLEFSDSALPLFGAFTKKGRGPIDGGFDVDELLRNTIDPEKWEHGSFSYTGDSLVVVNEPATIARIRRFLEREIRPRIHRGVAVEFELVSVPAVLARALRATGDGALDDTRRSALDAALRDGSARRVFGLRGNGTLGSRFVVWHGRQIAVLGDFDVEVAQAARAADPVVQVVQAGGYLAVLAAADDDRKRISLDLDLRLDELVGLRRNATRNSGDLELPDLRTEGSRVSVTLPAGRWAIVASGMPAPGDHRIFLVRASLLERGGAR